MLSVKFLFAAVAVSFSTMAYAAELPIAAPPLYAPPADFGGWYLRGDIGMTNQGRSRIDGNTAALFSNTTPVGLGFDGSPLFGMDVGYGATPYFADKGKWNFVREAHAGLAYGITPSVTLELAYSYINLGSAAPGPFPLFDGATRSSPSNITSNDLTLGSRWSLESHQAYAPPPVTKS